LSRPAATTLIVEGGGDSNHLRRVCRAAFRKLLEKTGGTRRLPHIVAGGSRSEAFKDFCREQALPGRRPLLLVDSESPVAGRSPWGHLAARDGWTKPNGATDGQCHLMVQCMEAWFLADRTALQCYFGNGFRASALPAAQQIESTPKPDLFRGLENATRQAKTKGKYAKGKHAFAILETLDPTEIRRRSPWAERFFALFD
jgi:hypothetical protein